MLYLECRMPAQSSLDLPDNYAERAAYVVEGRLRIDDEILDASKLAVLRPGGAVRIDALQESRVMIIGGTSVGKRHIWWNFVSTSKERIEEAKADWRDGRLAPIPGDDKESIPLPE
jgi:redox-sensitive bicupin YhaK (pirin superfamily)